MNSILTDGSLFLTILFTGFYAGTGFFIIMGGNPAILKMSNRTFAEYWQHTDLYMAARMKFFGPLLLLTLLSTILVHISEAHSVYFWFLIAAFLILIADIVLIFGKNHPLNHLIQSWDLNNLPGDVEGIKHKVVRVFWLRSAFMIGSFVCALLAVFLRFHSL